VRSSAGAVDLIRSDETSQMAVDTANTIIRGRKSRCDGLSTRGSIAWGAIVAQGNWVGGRANDYQ
jgi:hypothetical protein